ncbi:MULTISPECIES: NADPH-dependent FMN reductase [unclassified Pseudomonas]|uniref:NADPH-dependent FMN reductase n=1 Tax=unclassified Pseudomonas TaxID=196821 RepID=UPI0035C1AC70
MNPKPRIALIIGSTRPTRFADVPAQWMLRQAQAREDLDVEVLDLRDYPLPFFDEVATNLFMPSQNAEVVRWQQTLRRFDGFIFVVAEYNFAIPAVLKNALDQAYIEWNYKPFTAIAYGGTGGVRAVENLRTISTALQMVSTRHTVNIGGADFFSVHPAFGVHVSIEEIEKSLLLSAKNSLDELVWWSRATMAARVDKDSK